VLWAQLASDVSEADIRSRLRDWVEALGGSLSESAPSIDSLKATLSELLKERACLLVLDDVWQKKQAQAFRVGGENCRLLLTTRDAEVARGLGARIQPIPSMSEGEALALLHLWADGALSGADGALLTRIIKALGRLPLALKLAGAQLQRKAPDKWLADFDARKLKSKRPEDVHDSLEQTFGLSLEQLEDAERRLYAALAIFKEDEPIREVAIHRLWSGLDERDADEAQDLLDDLAARALLEVVGDEYPRAALLHDLLRDFMAAELTDPQAAHRTLLETYQATQSGAGWHTAPDDGYLYGHLAYHLMALHQSDALRGLLLDYRWLQARLDATNAEGLMSDCAYLPEDDAIRLIQSALSMSAHVLNEDKSALVHQLVGRLMTWRKRNEAILALTDSFMNNVPGIYPAFPDGDYPPLLQAGGPLLRTLAGHEGAGTR
jgi:hypothetical protein